MSGDVVEWVRYLKEVGVRELRVPEAPVLPAAVEEPTMPSPEPPSPRKATPVRKERESASTRSRPTAETPPAKPRPETPATPAAPLSLGMDEPAPADPAAALAAVREEIGDCTRCKLCEQRTNIVFGVGDPKARLMFVGEGPGAEEDARGEPFVGRAGKKLDDMIRAIGLERDQVYIANIVKCRPPRNRDPETDEIATCSPFLYRQIAAIRPRVIVTLGAPATKTLLGTKIGITKLRGQWHECLGIPVMPTFHPAYLLRAYTVENRKKVWDDLIAARERVDQDA